MRPRDHAIRGRTARSALSCGGGETAWWFRELCGTPFQKLGPTADLMFEGVAYMMPPEAAHLAGTAFVYEDHIRLVAGARHEVKRGRRKPREPSARLLEPRIAKLAAAHGDRARRYEKRQQRLDLGADARTLLTAGDEFRPLAWCEAARRGGAAADVHSAQRVA